MSGRGNEIEYDFKSNSSRSKDKDEGVKNGRILCYVCGGNGANWSLFSKAIEDEKSPHFPFLQTIDKAEGAQAMRSNGRIDACTVCFSFLVQQWHSYEENDTPVSKRTYWLKRSGAVNNDTLSSNEEKVAVDDAYNSAGKSHEIVEYDNSECVDVAKGMENNCLDLSSLDENKRGIDHEPSRAELLSTMKSENNKKQAKESKGAKRSHEGSDSTDRGETCCSCGVNGENVSLKTAHTKPQLKMETPFYPFLSQRSNNVDFMGRVAVCKNCQIHLLKQWERYEKERRPLSERYYTLRSAADTQKESNLIICFVCGEKHPESSSRDVRATKGKQGVPYFPSLLRRLPAAGASEVSEAGVCKVCESCQESLTNQWNSLDDSELGAQRAHSIDKQHAIDRRNDVEPGSPNRNMYLCSVCKKLKPKDQIDCVYEKEEHAMVSSKMNHSGRSLVCYDCKTMVKQSMRPSISHVKPIESIQRLSDDASVTRKSEKSDSNPNKHIVPQHKSLHFETCFLCGEKVTAMNLEYLYVFPHQYVNGIRPFFPSLAYRVPAYHAKPPSTSGTVITCTYCHGNMISQWYECEKHEQHGISNPWVRQYVFNQFTCYLCSKIFSRQKVTTVASSDFPFLAQVRRPQGGFRINNQKDYVVCHHCKEILHIQKENFDKCNVEVSERDYELPMVERNSKLGDKRKTSESQSESSHPAVVVIGDSEPEGEDGEVWNREERTSVSNVVTSSRALTNTGGLLEKVTQASSVSMSSPTSGGQNSSFAAALRKLAKQAMSPGSQSPVSVLPPPSNSTMSPVKNNGCESPKINGTPTICKKEITDSAYLSSKENRIHPNLPSSSDIPGISGHQIVPGVFSLGQRGYEGKPGVIDELHGAPGRVQDIPRVRAVHPPPQPYYMPFLQRPTMPDSMYLPFPYYPPTMMEPPGLLPPPGFDHEAWRKRRALEHMRQQHERHAQFLSPHERPLYIMEQDHFKPLSVQASMSQRQYPGDLPLRGEKTLGKSSPRLEASTSSDPRTTASTMPKEMTKTSEALGTRSPSRVEQLPVSSSFLRQSGSSTTPVIISNPHSPVNHQTSLSSPSRDVPTHNDREGENMKDGKQREHQILWTRRMFEQKRRLRQEEIEWQHRQQQVRQQKREVQQELFQFRQKLLQQKELEKDDSSKKEQERGEPKDDAHEKERGRDGHLVSPENKMGLSQYGYNPMYHDSPLAPQPMTMSSMFPPPRLPHHEMFYPPGYLPQASLPPRMDTRMYKEYLQQPTHFMHDNKSVSEWLEKQRHPDGKDRLSSNAMFINGEISKDAEKHRHEPQKLKFMNDLGLMTVSDKQERPQKIFVGGKRKFPEDTIQDESNKENRVENGDVSADTGMKKANVSDEDAKNATHSKQVEFLSNLGLVTHRKRQELEDDFEKNRWERRHQRLQKKSKKGKKEKKEEKNRSRTPLDLDVSGPMTRQKQQLLQEYGLLLPIKDAMEKESSSSPDSSATADRDSVKSKDSPGGQAKKSKKSESPAKDETFRNSYDVSTPPPRLTATSTALSSGPQLTLQSLTHMENPYRTFPSAFHPPFYPSSLLSVHQDPTGKDPRISTEFSAPSRTGSKSYSAIVPGNIGVYRGNGAETRPSWTLTEEPLKWPGTSKVIQSYLAYHQEPFDVERKVRGRPTGSER
ncbi:uncharacterized protein LOC114532680 isoform X2 [Dendronephthya gigantea]|uniref:uncharacterized protein LOC114532680 isoform X2 n=1 Tax=Dendronephthya gigantea TaxID=151771 RepID=UPI00106C465D|nr:uncharacterized protein LOC114532680 isoform X2 [Dendronephthya gigantea]